MGEEFPDASKEAANHAWWRRLWRLPRKSSYRVGLRDGLSKKGRRTPDGRLRAIELIGAAEQQTTANVNPALVMENIAEQLSDPRSPPGPTI